MLNSAQPCWGGCKPRCGANKKAHLLRLPSPLVTAAYFYVRLQEAAIKVLRDLCEADLRCLDTHAHIGNFFFDHRSRRLSTFEWLWIARIGELVPTQMYRTRTDPRRNRRSVAESGCLRPVFAGWLLDASHLRKTWSMVFSTAARASHLSYPFAKSSSYFVS